MIFAEGLRRLKCCQPSLNFNIKIQLMDQLSEEMHQAGYNQNFRKIMLTRILSAYTKLLRDHESGTSMYKEPRDKQTDNQWFAKLGYKASMNVPATEGSTLAKNIQAKLKAKGQNIKLVETAGPSIRKSLQVANPNPIPNCGRPECLSICQQFMKDKVTDPASAETLDIFASTEPRTSPAGCGDIQLPTMVVLSRTTRLTTNTSC